MASWLRFRDTFNRTNLRYVVHQKPEGAKAAIKALADLLRAERMLGKCGIIYVWKRKDAEAVARALEDELAGDVLPAAGAAAAILSRNRRTLSRNEDPSRSCAMQCVRSEKVFCKKLTGWQVYTTVALASWPSDFHGQAWSSAKYTSSSGRNSAMSTDEKTLFAKS